MKETDAAYRLQEMCKDILAYQVKVIKTAEDGNDGGDVYEAEEMWKEIVENAKGILDGTA